MIASVKSFFLALERFIPVHEKDDLLHIKSIDRRGSNCEEILSCQFKEFPVYSYIGKFSTEFAKGIISKR